MDPNIHEHQSEVELFEDSWFYTNLLHRKPRMLRSNSDPCTSSITCISDNKSYEETYESIKKLPLENEFTRSNLIKSPSMPLPPSAQRRDHDQNDTRRSKSSNRRKASGKLARAPSLPISLGVEEIEDEEEIEFSLGKLIRQASLNRSDQLPPRTHSAKAASPCSSISRHRLRTKPEPESFKSENLEEKTPQLPANRLQKHKSLSVLESEELQGSKDFEFDFDKKELKQNVARITPGTMMDENEENNTRRPYTADTWRGTSLAPPVPRWAGKKSRDEVKVQIKFWARAVASNVRQEC